MEYRNLGRTGVQVSPLCLGCMNFGGRTNEMDSIRIIHRALEAGINFLDTADMYGFDSTDFPAGKGASEEIVGKALKQNGQRAQVVLATKVHYPMSNDPNARGNSRRHILEGCEASLRRLQTDYIDLYQLHDPSPEIPMDETLRALDDLIRAGKVRYIGASSFAAWEIVEALWVSKEYRLNRFISEQPPYNLLDRRIERELIPMAQTYGIAILAWSPLAGGFLTGKYRRGEPAPAGSRFDAFYKFWWKEHVVDAAFDVVGEIGRLSAEKGSTPAQLALAWCMHQPGITSVIIGPRTIEHLEDCLGASNVSIVEKDLERLNKIALPGRMIVPYYKYDGWKLHRFQW
jgi:aryl-alcohol dehydrogenase-like predicted oxidoreductase